MFGFRVPAPDEAMLISGGTGGRGRHAVQGRDRSRRVRRAVRPPGQLPDAGDARGRGRRAVRDQAGHRAPGHGGDRVQGRQRPESIVNAGAAVPVRSGPDVRADRADLRRSPALDRRLDDRRGDRHRAPEAGHRGARRLQGGDGQDGTDRRLAADPVDRRHGRGLHRRDGRAPQRRDPAPGQDRPGAGQPGGGRGRAGVRSASRPSTQRETAVVQAKYKAEVDKAQAEAGQAGPLAEAERPARGDRRSDRAGPAPGRAAPAAARRPRWSSPPRPRPRRRA